MFCYEKKYIIKKKKKHCVLNQSQSPTFTHIIFKVIPFWIRFVHIQISMPNSNVTHTPDKEKTTATFNGTHTQYTAILQSIL